MCLLIETIRVVNGVPLHLAWHEKRMNIAKAEYWPGSKPETLLNLPAVPPELSEGTVRCNVTYGPQINDIKFKPYSKQDIRRLKLVDCNTIDYHAKFLDRTSLESLLALRSGCDEILIIKDGLITDTSISNIIFYDGSTWYTPEKPLLKGTCRERLLDEGKIFQSAIRADDLHRFAGCKLINAMRFPEEEEMIMISHIFAPSGTIG